jgi:predicted acylesterase/phospholipase RssA
LTTKGILPAIELKRKRPDGKLEPYLDEGQYWRDGSLRMDVPITMLHQSFRVNFTVVNQVNPHVFLFFFESKGSSGKPTAHRQGQGWRGGFVASTLELAVKLDLMKWLRIIRDLQLMPIMFSQDWYVPLLSIPNAVQVQCVSTEV